MKWTTETRKLANLIPYEYNPRSLSEAQKDTLKQSLKKFNLVELPAINADGTIISGHQRITILTELYGTDHEIEVRVPDRHLSEKELEEYCIRANQNTGSWDYSLLEQYFSTPDLIDWGFHESQLPYLSDDSMPTEFEEDEMPIGLGHEYKILVECRSEAEQEELYHKLKDQGFACKTI